MPAGQLATAGVEEVSVVVVLVAGAAATLVAAPAVASAEVLTSEAVLLVRRTQTLEERSTVEVGSASACIVLRVDSRALQLGPHISVPLSRRGHPCCRVPADIRVET